MKKTLLLLACTIGLFACGNNEAEHHHDHEGHDHTMTEQPAATSEVAASGKVDPVCKMSEGEIPWTEFSVADTDTTWFCSPHCKELYDGDPAKYQL